jgi:hypothetical protein
MIGVFKMKTPILNIPNPVKPSATGLFVLRELACQSIRLKYPNLPESAIRPPRYCDRSENGLTRCIVDFISLSGGWATRISTTGQMRPGGGTEVNPKMRWVHGTTKRGTADIHAVYQGIHLSIEVKMGRDRQSPAQRKVEQEVTAAGGIYYLARDFQNFYEWVQGIKKEGPARPSSTLNTHTQTHGKDTI